MRDFLLRRHRRRIASPAARCAALLIGWASLAMAADAYKDGWTPKALDEAVGACTDALVEGAWENTKREQGADPAMPLTPEIRKQLAPQIESFRGLCHCTVKATARKYGKTDFEKQPEAMERYAKELVTSGRCKPSPPK